MESQKEHKIVVLGSASKDVFFKLDKIPVVGETRQAHGLEIAYGGKGANQALACGRLGAPVEMLVQLGNDIYGHGIIKYFQESNVGVKYAKIIDGVETGQAYIMSQNDGNNSIIIVGAANIHYPDDLEVLDPMWMEQIAKAKILVLQREITDKVNVIAAKWARQNNTLVILDVGGRDDPFTDELLSNIDIISPNESELVRVVGKQLKNSEEEREEISKLIGRHPHLMVVLKKGEFGATAYYLDAESKQLKETSRESYKFEDYPQFKLVDTTGAGDCFTGAFAMKMLENRDDLDGAIKFGHKAGFLCITKFGAGPSVPYLREIQETFKD